MERKIKKIKKNKIKIISNLDNITLKCNIQKKRKKGYNPYKYQKKKKIK